MNDDWRVQIDLREGVAEALLDNIEMREVESEVSAAFHDRVIVSRDGNRLFLYAGTREQAEQAREFVVQAAGEDGVETESELRALAHCRRGVGGPGCAAAGRRG